MQPDDQPAAPPLPIAILVLAAGASTRMQGRDKLLEPVAGDVPLLAERLKSACATGQKVLVALPPQTATPERWKCLQNLAATPVAIGNRDLGLSASIAGLIGQIPPECKGAMILPADMPDITTRDLHRVLAAFTGTDIVRGASDGKPGHPVIFPRAWFARLAALCGDRGARDILQGAPITLADLPGSRALTDLDTMADWAAWRAEKQPSKAKIDKG